MKKARHEGRGIWEDGTSLIINMDRILLATQNVHEVSRIPEKRIPGYFLPSFSDTVCRSIEDSCKLRFDGLLCENQGGSW